LSHYADKLDTNRALAWYNRCLQNGYQPSPNAAYKILKLIGTNRNAIDELASELFTKIKV
jgi:hypothetical protein